MNPYKSRSYCKSIGCQYQKYIDTGKWDNGETANPEYIKNLYCKICDAYKFHQWLKDNGYKIVKEE